MPGKSHEIDNGKNSKDDFLMRLFTFNIFHCIYFQQAFNAIQ